MLISEIHRSILCVLSTPKLTYSGLSTSGCLGFLWSFAIGGFAGSFGVEELEVTFSILFGDLGAGAAFSLAPAENERGDFNGMARFFATPCDVGLPFLLLSALG